MPDNCRHDMLFDARVQPGRIDLPSELGRFGGDGRFGALVSFTGFCRDEDNRLAALEIEHYPGMAEGELRRIVEEARERWSLMAGGIVHRFGMIAPGEEIVLVACGARHRQAAFEAASFIMDFMKTSAPFWKREHLADGTVGGWVEARDTDTAASDRWHRL